MNPELEKNPADETETGSEQVPAEKAPESKKTKNPLLIEAEKLIYQDKDQFNRLMEVLEAGKSNISEAAAEVTFQIVDVVRKKSQGGMDEKTMYKIWFAILISVYRLAFEKGLLSEKVDKNTLMNALGIVVSKWIAKYPGEANQKGIQDLLNSPEASEVVSNAGLRKRNTGKQTDQAPAGAEPPMSRDEQIRQRTQPQGLIEGAM